jgi:TolB-like protein/class 3 adenylate cyclase/Tfp pilus assembly protein PilF
MSQSRQLAAIMFTDIVGYTALMGEDEKKAFSLLDANRKLQKPLISKNGGEWIKELGDGVMASFSSVTDSVGCACAIIKGSQEIEGLKLRIGIHLGEVVIKDKDVFGDGVNIASRLQAIAPVNGIYVSEAVYNNLSNNKEILSHFVGEETLKNVRIPIKIYSIDVLQSAFNDPAITIEQELKVKPRSAPAKSIAVLPFVNMSNDPEQEYFSDGISEEILNSLTHIKDLKVAGRTSSFQFKGKNIDIREIGKNLGVINVLEGSVRKQALRLRITAQLINSDDGYHLWSEKYDRDLNDIFAIQDEIAHAITEKLKITLLAKEKEAIDKAPTLNIEAYEFYLKGRFYWTKRGRWLANALQSFQQAITLDPAFARAYAGIADSYSSLGMYGIIPPNDAMPKARAAAEKAVALDDSLNEAYTSIAFIKGFYERDLDLARKYFKTADQINPNYATGRYWHSFYLTVVEQKLKQGEEEGLRAIELEPYNAICYYVTGLAYLAQRNYKMALRQADKAIELDPNLFLPHFLSGWCKLESGDYSNARIHFTDALMLSNRHSWPLGFLILTESMSGNKPAAKQLMAEILEREKTQYFSVLGSVIGAAALEDEELMMYFLVKGNASRDTLMPIFNHLYIMPAFLRGSERATQFLREKNMLGDVTVLADDVWDKT